MATKAHKGVKRSASMKKSNPIKKGKSLQQVKPLSKGSLPTESVSLNFTKIEYS
ncbi:MAG: hypothetical protein WA211_21385 [Candidatus Acidiferrales bacterium]